MGDTDSLRPNDHLVIIDDEGRVVDRSLHSHSERLQRRLHHVGTDVWTMVGNGLSNQTFVRGPRGVIAIDTGESIEEMSAALAEFRTVCADPVTAVIYTHFHYVAGTAALTATEPITEIWGHSRIAVNRARSTTEIGPAYGRGLVEQFAIRMPLDGPDGLVNVGLGLAYRMPEHAPFTDGHLPVTHTFESATRIEVAGLTIDVTPAPSDADDSVTLWFPALGTAVHNLMWPALFNIFAIRGEEYRDPRMLLDGLDHLRGLGAEHLVATHGPPLSGRGEIDVRLGRYRDSIQFLWDQTVRWTNRGATSAELAHLIRLPAIYGDDWLTEQHYGIAEHHVRQIRSGLFGFFDGDEISLLPLAPTEHADRMIEALGGVETAARLCDAAAEDEPRWALHLAGLLAHRTDSTPDDRRRLAGVLRIVARRTPSANLRNWCLTRALDLEGSIDMSRHRTHRITRSQAERWDLGTSVAILRVMVDPDRLDHTDVHIAVVTEDGRAGLHFRNHIACPTDGEHAPHLLRCERRTWNAILAGETTLDEAVRHGGVMIEGDPDAVLRTTAALDHPAFSR